MAYLCDCPRDHLCSTCFDQRIIWHSGLAVVRGERWAADVARRRPELLAEPWPELASGSRALEIAVRKLADLTDDVRVLDRLLVELQAGAVAAWGRARKR